MKRKAFIFTLILIAIVSVFAITAGAATTVPQFTEVIDVSSTIDISGLASEVQSDNSSRVMLVDENGDYQTYLSKYITKFGGGASDHSQISPYFDALNKATGKNYSYSSIIAIEIPEGTQRISNNYSSTDQ